MQFKSHVMFWIKFCPLGVASPKEVCERKSMRLAHCKSAALFYSYIRDVNSSSSLSERGPIAVLQETQNSNQSERTTPDCQQTYIRVAVKRTQYYTRTRKIN